MNLLSLLTLFSNLGHNTAFADDKSPVEIVINWIKEKSEKLKL